LGEKKISEMLTDLLQNIYGRISNLGKSIKSLQNSIDGLNQTLTEKVASLVTSIHDMTENVKQEGEMHELIFREIGEEAINEVRMLQKKVGLKDLDELMTKLEDITAASEEALKPEVVDILLHEVLGGIKELKSSSLEIISTETDEEIMNKVDKSLQDQQESLGK
jgi:hypothetical protein